MAYNGQSRGYEQPTYDPRYRQHSNGYNRYEQTGAPMRGQRYQERYTEPYNQYQETAYAHNGQYYTQHQDQVTDGYQEQAYNGAGRNEYDTYDSYGEMPQTQQRQYQYDERFHATSRERQPQYDNLSRQRTPQTSRPGTSASNHKAKCKSNKW